LYQVSNQGRVKSFQKNKNGKLLKPAKSKYGYLIVCLSKDGKSKTIKVHRLVASAFCHKPKGSTEVNHKNEDKACNYAWNLEWCTAQYNVEYSKAKYYKFLSPDGEVVEVFNLRKFSREKGLDQSNLSRVHAGKQPYHKGWTKA
jgi:hypothetical protein